MPFWWRKKEEAKDEPQPPQPALAIPRLKVEKSFTLENVNKTKSELRLSSVEREIIGDALTRLYEAAAEGRITEEERDRLAAKYKENITKLDSTIDHSQKIIGLHELEESRAELVKMFQDKFSELNTKIDEIRRGIGVIPPVPKEVAEKFSLSPIPEGEEKPRVAEKAPATTPSTPRRTKADETLDKLRDELQKQLEKLEQIEMEV